MARIQLSVEMKGIYSFEVPAYGYGMETRYIYNMVGEDGTVYVWKTSKFWCCPIYGVDTIGHNTDSQGRAYVPSRIVKGDKLIITATVKGQEEYKGEQQTLLTRVKLVERVFHAESWEEAQERKAQERKQQKQEQLNSIKGGDMIWRMPYKQYKEHYSDCETVIDSYDNGEKAQSRYAEATVQVIIREGRLKASGVRGKHYHGYTFRFTFDGKTGTQTFRAISEETALKQLSKSFKGATDIELEKVYQYYS